MTPGMRRARCSWCGRRCDPANGSDLVEVARTSRGSVRLCLVVAVGASAGTAESGWYNGCFAAWRTERKIARTGGA